MSDVLRRIRTVYSIDDNEHNRKLKEIRNEYQLTAERIKTMDSVLANNGKNIKDLNEKQKALVETLKNAAAIEKTYTESISKTTTKLAEQKRRYEEIKSERESIRKQIKDEIKLNGENSDKIKELEEQYAELGREMQNYGSSINRNENNLKKYGIEIEVAKQNQQNLAKQISDTEKELKNQESAFYQTGLKAKEYGEKLKTVGKAMSDVGSTMTRYISLPIAAAGIASIKFARDFETAFVGVKKTVEESDVVGGYDAIKNSIREMAREIPATHEAIASVVEVAGRLGVQGDSIMKFSRVMIDLGESTDMVASTAADSLAKFANITGMSQNNFDRLGSTIVDLGNNFAATESEIVDMGLRLAAAGKQANMSEANILAFAAGLTSLGLEAEAGGSAFSKLIFRVSAATQLGGEELEKFASIAGMTGNEFKTAFHNNASTALTAFLRGLKETDKSGKGMLLTLQELGIKEIRMRDATMRAANGVDVLNSALSKGNNAWKENNALTEEANKRYASSESQMQININRMKDQAITIGEKLLPTVVRLTDSVADMVDAFSELSPETQDFIIQAAAIAMIGGPVIKTLGNITEGVGGILKAYGKYATSAKTVTTTTASIGGSFLKFAPQIGIAIAAIGAITTIMWVANAPFRKYKENVDDVVGSVGKFSEEIKSVTPIISNFNQANGQFDEAINSKKQAISKAEPEITNIYRANINDRINLTDQEISKIQEYLGLLDSWSSEVAKKYKARLEIAKESLSEETAHGSNEAAKHVATALAFDSELTKIVEETYVNKRMVVQNGIDLEMKLRQEGKIREADLQKQTNEELKAWAKKSHDEQIQAINKETSDYLEANLRKYVSSNKIELDGINKLNDIRKTEISYIKEMKAEKAKLLSNALIGDEDRFAQESAIISKHEQKLKALMIQENRIWNTRTEETAGALLNQVSNILVHGGKITLETSNMVNGILSAMGRTPEGATKIKEMMERSIRGIADNEPELATNANRLVENFNAVINSLPEGKYENGSQIITALTDGVRDSSGKMASTMTEVNDVINEKLDMMKEQMGAKVPETVKPMEEAIPTIEAFAGKMSMTLEKTTEELNKIGEQFLMSQEEIMIAVEASGVGLEDFAKFHGENVKKIEDSITNFVEIATMGFSELKQNTAISLEEYMENMRKNQEAMQSWATNTQALMKAGVSEGIIQELAKLGPAGAAQAQQWVDELEGMNGGALGEFETLNSTTQEYIDKFNDTYVTGLETANEAAKVQHKANDYGGQGKMMVMMFIEAMIRELPYMKEVARKLGIGSGEGVANGIDGANPKATGSARTLREKVEYALRGSSTYSSGYNVASGVADGIYGGSYLATNAAAWLASNTKRAFDNNLEIYSPSRAMKRSGKNIVEGTADGIVENISLMENAMGKLAQVPLKAELKANPTITRNNFDNYKSTVDINVNISGEGSDVLKNDQNFTEKVKSIVLNQIVVGNRTIPNRTSLLGI